MEELKKVRLAEKENNSTIENCDCSTDCCDTSTKSESCCDEAMNKDCCNEKSDCCDSAETTECCDNSTNDECCNSNDNSCSCNNTNTQDIVEKGVAVVDGKQIELGSTDINLVELAKKANINIPAPCYFAKRKGGCCNACVVEVDGEQKYACATTPKDGMNITVNRPDLKALRKERILKYKEGLKSGNPTACSIGK